MRINLTLSEWQLICDTCHRWFFQDVTPTVFLLLEIEIHEAIKQKHVDKKWGVDGDLLLRKIKSFRHSQLLAIVDTVERFFGAKQSGSEESDEDLLIRLGALR